MKCYLLNLKTESLLLLFLLIILVSPIYLFKLGSIPSDITGDESTYLNISYRILFAQDKMNILTFPEDTKPAINFYWHALWINIFGEDNALFAMRFSITLLSLTTLIVFFFSVKRHLSAFSSFLSTLLMATNILYLNFSRSGWLNHGAILMGLLLFNTVEKKGLNKHQNNHQFYLSLGILTGICFYTYLSGVVFAIAASIYISFTLLRKQITKNKVISLFTYIVTTVVVVLPLTISAYKNLDFFLLRPNTVFIFNNLISEVNNPAVMINTFISQVIEVVKGLFLMSGEPIGKGIENARYFPIGQSLLSLPETILFLSGVLIVIIKHKPLGLWVLSYVITLLTVGTLTIDAPNLARTITVLPFIYLMIGLTIDYLRANFSNIFPTSLAAPLFVGLTIAVSSINIFIYFSWIQNPNTYSARQPAIDYLEYPRWQKYQIERAKQGYLPITNYEWYETRKNLP